MKLALTGGGTKLAVGTTTQVWETRNELPLAAKFTKLHRGCNVFP